MLRDFTFLDLFSERGTVAGAVATRAADFLGAFGHDGIFVDGGGDWFWPLGGDCSAKPCLNVTLNFLFAKGSSRRRALEGRVLLGSRRGGHEATGRLQLQASFFTNPFCSDNYTFIFLTLDHLRSESLNNLQSHGSPIWLMGGRYLLHKHYYSFQQLPTF